MTKSVLEVEILHHFMIGLISALSMFINVKILIQDKKVSFLELVFASGTAFLIGYLYHMLISVWRYYFNLAFSVVILYLLPQLLLVLFLRKKGYSLKKAAILSSLSVFVWILLEMIVWLIWENRLMSAFENPSLTMVILYIINVSIPSVLITILFVHLTKQLRSDINQSENLQKMLAVISQTSLVIGSLILMLVPIIFGVVDAPSFLIITVGLALAVVVGSGLFVTFILYAKNLESKHRLHRKEEEQVNLLYYTSAIEKQYTEIRKFRHDYENILTSLQSFIMEKDYAALETYYFEKLKPASDRLILNKFQLEPLSRIDIKEVKSILAVKLMSAQVEEIEVKFEVPKVIDKLPIDTVALVRMIGILLDNATEELKKLGTGVLSVGLLKGEGYVEFIVQNTCSLDIPPLNQLKQIGFSTKGEGRGLGLPNLIELVHENPLISLETRIEQGQFIQVVTIAEQK